MTTRVAFLRAVNVGKRRVDMRTLNRVVTDLGHGADWTHGNSGNAVFACRRLWR